MSNGPWWAKSPIVVVPIAAIALGLCFVPFAIGNVDHVAQFYGSLMAALVTAIAVLGTTSLSAHLTRQQRREERHEQLLADATEFHAWLDKLRYDLKYVNLVLTKFHPGPIKTEIVRRNVSPDLRSQLRAHLGIASRLPQPLGHEIVGLLYDADGALDTVVYMPLSESEFELNGDHLSNAAEIAGYYWRMVAYQRAKLGQYLIQNGVMPSLSSMDAQALKEGRPIYKMRDQGDESP